MNRLLPQTLFGRMVFIMISGYVIAQLLTSVIFFQERERFGSRVAIRHLSTQLAELTTVLNYLSVKQRKDIALLVSHTELVFSIDDTPLIDNSNANAEIKNIIASELTGLIGDKKLLNVVVTDFQKNQPDNKSMEHEGKKIQIQVLMDDGSRVTFASFLPLPSATFFSSRFITNMLIRLAVVIVLTLIAVRLATRPLQALAFAAEELGKNVYRAPLENTGPLEVRRAASAFNTMQKKLIDYIHERSRILAAVSHDLKTPITRLRLRAELLDNDQLKNKFIQDLEEMETMASSTLDFVHGLEKIPAWQNVDIMTLLESLQTDAQELGHEIKIIGNAPNPIQADAQSLKRCLVNLMENGYKYGKRVVIFVNQGPSQLNIAIRDEGPGIPDSQMEKVFDPFYRIEESRNRSTGGTGLGLSIARNAAKANGGDVFLRNHPEGGLEAQLVLPVS